MSTESALFFICIFVVGFSGQRQIPDGRRAVEPRCNFSGLVPSFLRTFILSATVKSSSRLLSLRSPRKFERIPLSFIRDFLAGSFPVSSGS